MNARTARHVLRTGRPSGEDDQERPIRAAVKFAAAHPPLDAEFHNQRAFDRALAERLGSIPLPAGLPATLEETALRLEARRARRFTLRDPAMLAVGLAFLFLLGLLGWIFLGQMGSFAGVQEVADLVAQGDKAGPSQFAEIETTAGSLTDWFVMKDFDGYVVPPGLETAPVIGVRLFNYDDIPVAAAAITRPRALLYVFAAQPLGLSLSPGHWRVAVYGPGNKRTFAVCQIASMGVALTLPGGTEAELRKFLATLGPPP